MKVVLSGSTGRWDGLKKQQIPKEVRSQSDPAAQLWGEPGGFALEVLSTNSTLSLVWNSSPSPFSTGF